MARSTLAINYDYPDWPSSRPLQAPPCPRLLQLLRSRSVVGSQPSGISHSGSRGDRGDAAELQTYLVRPASLGGPDSRPGMEVNIDDDDDQTSYAYDA